MTKKKLIEVLGQIPSVLKAEGKNDYLKYEYLTLDQLKKIFHDAFAKVGVVFAFNCVDVEVESQNDGIRVLAKFIAEFSDGEDAYQITTFGMAFDKEGKGLAKAKTDALKRLFTDSFLIAVGEDDEDDVYGAEQEPVKKDLATGDIKQDMATDKQIKAIRALLNANGIKEEEFKKKIGKEHFHSLTKQEASKIIEELQNL